MYSYKHIDQLLGTPINELPINIKNNTQQNELKIAVGLSLLVLLGVITYQISKEKKVPSEE